MKISCKGNRIVGKANKGIKVKNNNRCKKLKLKKKIRKTPQNCKNPIERQRFITTVKNVTEGKKNSKA